MRLWLLVLSLCLAPALGCNLENDGATPVPSQLNFPIALELSGPAGGASNFLYVANSNFDLRYANGSIMAIDLAAVEAASASGGYIDPATVVRGQVLIGSLASGLALAPDGRHLYASVRGENALVYVDVDPTTGRLSCGQSAPSGEIERCGASREVGDESVASSRRISLPRDPTGVVAGSIRDLVGPTSTLSGDYVVVSHRAGAASLFLAESEGESLVPRLVHVLDNLPGGLVNVRRDPDQTMWMPSHDVASDRPDNFIARVGVAIDESSPADSFLYDAGTMVLAGINDGEDTRDIAFETTATSRRAYILSRRPEALVVVDLDQSTPTRLDVHDLVSLGFGPSRMALATFDVGGAPETVVFVSCFDSGDVWAVLPDRGRVVSIARELSGPFEMEIDVPRRRMYVADFTSSVVRVVSLDNLLTCLAGGVTATCEMEQLPPIGRPRPVRELI